MSEIKRTGFSERLKTAADAKAALLAKLRPKPTVTASDFQPRAEAKAKRDARYAARKAR